MKALAGVKHSFRLQCLLNQIATVPTPESVFQSKKVPRIQGSRYSESGSKVAAASVGLPGGDPSTESEQSEAGSGQALPGRLALNDPLYQLLRSHRQHRRVFINSLIAQFSECIRCSEQTLLREGLIKQPSDSTSGSTSSSQSSPAPIGVDSLPVNSFYSSHNLQ